MWNHNFLFSLIIYSHAQLLRLQFCLAHSARVWAPSRLVCIYLHVISTSNLQTWKGRLVKKCFASLSPPYLAHTHIHTISGYITSVWLEEQLDGLRELYPVLDICFCDFVYKRWFWQLIECARDRANVSKFTSCCFICVSRQLQKSVRWWDNTTDSVNSIN